jgi:hypothetical protein
MKNLNTYLQFALDGAWRSGKSSVDISKALCFKQATNESRTWPDWRTAPQDKAICHTSTTTPDTQDKTGLREELAELTKGNIGYLTYLEIKEILSRHPAQENKETK